MLRYLRLFAVQLRASTVAAMQYRLEFLVGGVLALFWTTWSIVPIVVVFRDRAAVAGWSFEEALVVVGWFTLMKGVLEGAVNPSLSAVVDAIRKGTLDFVLLKPADAQFLVSTTRFAPWRAADVLGGLALFGIAFHRMGRTPSAAHVALAAVLLGCATLVLYSLWILVVSAAFFVVKVDNLSFLFASIYDAARWPVSVFRGLLRLLFTFVIPLALMTTYPALALLGRLDARLLAEAVGVALLFTVAARAVWLRSIGHYTSASS
ncbi:MAG TPA: ABC-2 family transporter protein [Anaeromyxobacteraceae bacterium]|nr:ABC-2 family transporter protein [Anaeromyxobacteraceae bacterium]